MFTENMSDQDWRMASMLQMNSNFVRKQKEEADQKRHRELLEERADARAEIKTHKDLLMEQNRIANIQNTMLQALPMVAESDRSGFVISRLKEFVEPAIPTIEDLFINISIYCKDGEHPEWELFKEQPPKEIAKRLVMSCISVNVEETQSFLPPLFKAPIEEWADIFITQSLVSMVKLCQLDYASVSESRFRDYNASAEHELSPAWVSGDDRYIIDYKDNHLESWSWPVSSYKSAPSALVKEISFITILIAVWNDNKISEVELVKMIKILKEWQASLTDEAAYGLLQVSIEDYNRDLKNQNQSRIRQYINKICTLAHPEQAEWIFNQLDELAMADMDATGKQQDFLKLIRDLFETQQNEKNLLASTIFGKHIPPATPQVFVNAGCVETNVAPEIAFRSLVKAFEQYNISNIKADYHIFNVNGDTGISIASFGQHVTGEVSDSPTGSSIKIVSKPSGQILDWGRGKKESNEIAKIVARLIETRAIL